MRTKAPLVAAVVLLLASVTAVLGVSSPAAADPADPEGGSPSLRQQLDAAARGYLDAKAKLESSQKRQKELATQATAVEAQVATKSDAVALLAANAYKNGPLASASALFVTNSPADLVDRMTLLDAIAGHEDRQLRDLATTKAALARARAAVDAEVIEQQKQLKAMEQRKRQAEKALAQVGGGQTSGSGGFSSANATPAPRNADGSWPDESCVVNDPTTSGCITARTLHALRQAQAAGFKRYASCHRNGGSGEHPLGRACDFASATGGFGGTATGSDRTYGNNLSAYFLRNADRLGVLYVIWFRQIWMASTGWRAYNGDGTPSGDHTNHVHLSVY